MDKIAVRDAGPDEAEFIVQMIRQMVTDRASFGGDAPATEDEAWEKLSVAFTTELQGENSKYVIAEAENGDRIGVAGAELRTLGAAFAPRALPEKNDSDGIPLQARIGFKNRTGRQASMRWGSRIQRTCVSG